MTTLVLWEVNIQPGSLAEAEKAFADTLPDTRSFPGCQRIEPYRNQNDPCQLVLVEYWDSFEHYKKYVQWRQETGVLPNFLSLCAGPPVLRSFDLMDG